VAAAIAIGGTWLIVYLRAEPLLPGFDPALAFAVLLGALSLANFVWGAKTVADRFSHATRDSVDALAKVGTAVRDSWAKFKPQRSGALESDPALSVATPPTTR
jgi:hypothetical protein